MTKFNNFPDLYRAAFAETNPAIKMALLSQVKKALDEWEETSHGRLATSDHSAIALAHETSPTAIAA